MAVAALALAPASNGMARSSVPDTGVVNVSRTSDLAEAEVELAVDANDPRHVLAASNAWGPDLPPPADSNAGVSGMMISVAYNSVDGGRTWTAQRPDHGGVGRVADPLAFVPGSPAQFQDVGNVDTTDPDVQYDRHGNAYFESGAAHNPSHNFDEVASVWRSIDGGRTWGSPSTAVSVIKEEHEELDRPWLAVDNSGGPRDGTLYMVFSTTPFYPEPPQVFVKTSVDHGQTWAPTVRADDGLYVTQFNPRERPVVDAGGTLYIVYDRSPVANMPFTPQVFPIHLAVARSTDGGRTFQQLEADSDIHRVTSPDESFGSAYSEMISAIAADPLTPGRIAVAWPEKIDDFNSRIMLRYSTDAGAHWSPRVDVADDPATVPDQHDHVALRWLPGGQLAVAWRDRRSDGGTWDGKFQQWVRLLVPDARGQMFLSGRAVQFTNGPQLAESPSGTARGYHGSTMPDEFQGLTGTADAVMLDWVQPAGRFNDMMFRSIPLTAFAAPVPGRGGTAGANGMPDTSAERPGLPGYVLLAALLLLGGLAAARGRARV